MQENEIKAILDKLPSDLLNCTKPQYNPMECFYYRVREKEITHSMIIADLLNPKGNHGMRDLYLESFLKSKDELKKILNENKLLEVAVRRERPVNRCETKGKGKRSIDITIEWNDSSPKKAIIIENKLNNAIEQYKQLEDYVCGMKDEGYADIFTVCLQGSQHHDIGAQVNFTPTELADVFSIVVPQQNNNLQTYITLLKNMDIMSQNYKLAEKIIDMDECSFNQIRSIVSAFKQIGQVYFKQIVDKLDQRFENAIEIKHQIKGDCLQIWHEESYNSGENKGFWIELYYCNDEQFEIWINSDDKAGDAALKLDGYVKSDHDEGFYRASEGVEKFVLHQFKLDELTNRLCDLLKKLYSL